jgi:peptidoglycan/LPS O-acetylase OafA/YrhL
MAVAMVVGYHFKVPGFSGGSMGVTVFFALSGFLITGVLTRAKTALTGRGLGRFYFRRVLRLYPALAFVALVCALYALVVLHGSDQDALFREVIASMTYTMDFVVGRGHVAQFGYLSQTWSLSVEEQFYLIWPLVLIVILMLSKKPKVRSLVVLAMACCFAAWRAHLHALHLDAHLALNFDGQADCLLYGCAAALSYAELRSWIQRNDSAATGVTLGALLFIGMMSLVHLNRLIPFSAGYALTSIASVLLILRLTVPAVGRAGVGLQEVFAWRLAVWVGTISYGIYLWHPVMIHFMKNALGFSSAQQQVEVAAAALTLTVFAAWFSHRFVELRFLRLKDRFEEPSSEVAVEEDGEHGADSKRSKGKRQPQHARRRRVEPRDG